MLLLLLFFISRSELLFTLYTIDMPTVGHTSLRDVVALMVVNHDSHFLPKSFWKGFWVKGIWKKDTKPIVFNYS